LEVCHEDAAAGVGLGRVAGAEGLLEGGWEGKDGVSQEGSSPLGVPALKAQIEHSAFRITRQEQIKTSKDVL